METVQTFEAQVKKRLLEHEFKPICIEATNRRKIVRKSWHKWAKNNREDYLSRLKKYREEHPEKNRQYQKKYRDNHKESIKIQKELWKRKRKINALWEILTYDGQRTL